MQKWTKHANASGTVGTDLDVTPVGSEKILFEMRVNAPLANDDATLEVYQDSTTTTANRQFNGKVSDRNADGGIEFPAGVSCSTKWIVKVTGGSGDLIADALHR